MNKAKISYKKSGVNISLANKFVKHIAKLTKSKKNSKNKYSSENIGAFGSVYDLSKTKIKNPLIVSSTDGVGTKIEVANKYQKFDTIGVDLVAMCVNDLIVQGARPLFFLDYIAIGKLKLLKVKKILKGIIKGCELAGCNLIGGETAEMPGVYNKGKFDLAGFSVGVVSKNKIVTKSNVKVGNVIMALPSSGLHSNGFSLVRNILKRKKIPKQLEKELLRPTKIYVNEILKLTKKNLINSAAHITGGGIIENIARSIPKNLSAKINLSKIRVLSIFSWLKKNNIGELEMLNTFNCGVGFCIIVKKSNVNKIKSHFKGKYKPYEIGSIVSGNGIVKLVNKVKW